MKLSQKCLTVLKNYSTIQPGLIIRATPSEGKTVLQTYGTPSTRARTEIEDVFNYDVILHNVSEFLALLSITNEPECDFLQDSVIIRGKGNSKIRLVYSTIDMVTGKGTPKEVDPSKFDIRPVMQLGLEKEVLKTIQKVANITRADRFGFFEENGKVILRVFSKGDASRTEYSIDLTGQVGTAKCDASFVFNIEGLNFIEGDYFVDIVECTDKESGRKFNQSKFTNKELDLVYYLALELPTK